MFSFELRRANEVKGKISEHIFRFFQVMMHRLGDSVCSRYMHLMTHGFPELS